MCYIDRIEPISVGQVPQTFVLRGDGVMDSVQHAAQIVIKVGEDDISLITSKVHGLLYY